VRNEEELEQALEVADPEIFLLSPRDADGDEPPLETVLDLLPNVPAGKLAIADLPLTTPEDIAALERAGVDAVIVAARDVSALAGGPPPEV
jgi:indole-3-glycerol phosphate synthase